MCARRAGQDDDLSNFEITPTSTLAGWLVGWKWLNFGDLCMSVCDGVIFRGSLAKTFTHFHSLWYRKRTFPFLRHQHDSGFFVDGKVPGGGLHWMWSLNDLVVISVVLLLLDGYCVVAEHWPCFSTISIHFLYSLIWPHVVGFKYAFSIFSDFYSSVFHFL